MEIMRVRSDTECFIKIIQTSSNICTKFSMRWEVTDSESSSWGKCMLVIFFEGIGWEFVKVNSGLANVDAGDTGGVFTFGNFRN